MIKDKNVYDCITLDELASLSCSILPNGDKYTYELLIDKLNKLGLLGALSLTDYAIDYGYGFIYSKERETPYGKFMTDRVYFTPEGIKFVIDELLEEVKGE